MHVQNPRIDLNNITFAYEINHPILTDISFQVFSNESIGLVGANGMGKSTLLKLFTGLCSDYRGTLMVCGIPVKKDRLREVREKIGYVFQDSDSQLFTNTVYDDVAFGPVNYGYTREEIRVRTDKALAMVQLEELKDRQIYKLSGGEKKLASIATILSMSPEIILMDEPTTALDPQNRRNLIRILNGLNQVKIIASHDLDMIMDTCERTILLYRGRVVKDGSTREILSDEALLLENGLELPLSLSGRKSN